MSAALLSIMDTARATGGTDGSTKPVLVGRFSGDGSERLASGRPCLLEIQRGRDETNGVLEGTVAVWGVNLSHPDSAATTVQVFKGSDGATGRTVFTTTFTYAAFANYNYIVIVNGVVIEQGAGAGKFTVSDVGGVSVITFGTALNINDRVEIHQITPVEILAAGAHEFERTQIVGKDLYWVAKVHATGDISRTLITLTPVV